MKKLLTLIAAYLFTTAIAQAQVPCDFTYSGDPATGVYTFSAPPAYLNMGNMFIWGISSNGTYLNGDQVSTTFTNSGAVVVTLDIYAGVPDSTLLCSSAMAVLIQLDSDTNQVFNCNIQYASTPANPNYYTFWTQAGSGDPVWTIDNGITVTSQTGTQIAEQFAPGVYNVCVSVPNNGLTCDACVDIVIPEDSTNVGSTCDASFYASAGDLTGFFIPTGYNNYNDTQYSWSFGDGASSTEMYPYHTYNQSGTYTVCLDVAGSNCSDSYCMDVFIPETVTIPTDSLCFAGFVISQENPFEVNVVNISTGLDVEFNWTISDALITVTGSGPFPTIQVPNTGAFLFCLEMTNNTGCSAIACDSIYVGDNGLIGGKVSSTGFTINVTSPQVLTGFTTSIATAETPVFSTYPNPFSETLTIDAGASAFTSYQLVSVDGKLVASGTVTGSTHVVPTNNLEQGIYLLSLTDRDGRRQVQKVVKK